MGIGFAIYLKHHPAVTNLLKEMAKFGVETISQEPSQRLHLTLINGDDGDREQFILFWTCMGLFALQQ